MTSLRTGRRPSTAARTILAAARFAVHGITVREHGKYADHAIEAWNTAREMRAWPIDTSSRCGSALGRASGASRSEIAAAGMIPASRAACAELRGPGIDAGRTARELRGPRSMLRVRLGWQLDPVGAGRKAELGTGLSRGIDKEADTDAEGLQVADDLWQFESIGRRRAGLAARPPRRARPERAWHCWGRISTTSSISSGRGSPSTLYSTSGRSGARGAR